MLFVASLDLGTEKEVHHENTYVRLRKPIQYLPLYIFRSVGEECNRVKAELSIQSRLSDVTEELKFL